MVAVPIFFFGGNCYLNYKQDTILMTQFSLEFLYAIFLLIFSHIDYEQVCIGLVKSESYIQIRVHVLFCLKGCFRNQSGFLSLSEMYLRLFSLVFSICHLVLCQPYSQKNSHRYQRWRNKRIKVALFILHNEAVHLECSLKPGNQKDAIGGEFQVAEIVEHRKVKERRG